MVLFSSSGIFVEQKGSDTACLQVRYTIRYTSCYSGEILEVSAFFVHPDSSYRRWVDNRMMSVENSFREGCKPYARVVWKVDSLEKNMKCNGTVSVIGVTGDEKESRVFWREHEL